jgi:hypothetical protein
VQTKLQGDRDRTHAARAAQQCQLYQLTSFPALYLSMRQPLALLYDLVYLYRNCFSAYYARTHAAGEVSAEGVTVHARRPASELASGQHAHHVVAAAAYEGMKWAPWWL